MKHLSGWTLTGETLATVYKPKLSDFLTQKLKQTHTLLKEIKKGRDTHPHGSSIYQQVEQEYKKHDQIGKQIYQAKRNLDSFCQESKPFSHPFYWAAFTCSGLNSI